MVPLPVNALIEIRLRFEKLYSNFPQNGFYYDNIAFQHVLLNPCFHTTASIMYLNHGVFELEILRDQIDIVANA